MIVATAARRNKDYEVEFVNTDINSDTYTLQLFLRRCANAENPHYKIKLAIISNILAYPALEMIWDFEENEYELASRVYNRVADEVDEIKTDFDRSMTPVATLASIVREAAKDISVSHQEKYFMLPIDEAAGLKGVSDWRWSLYSGRYPNTSKKEKQKMMKFEGNEAEKELGRKSYKTRERY